MGQPLAWDVFHKLSWRAAMGNEPSKASVRTWKAAHSPLGPSHGVTLLTARPLARSDATKKRQLLFSTGMSKEEISAGITCQNSRRGGKMGCTCQNALCCATINLILSCFSSPGCHTHAQLGLIYFVEIITKTIWSCRQPSCITFKTSLLKGCFAIRLEEHMLLIK